MYKSDTSYKEYTEGHGEASVDYDMCMELSDEYCREVQGILPILSDDDGDDDQRSAEINCKDMKRIRDLNIRIRIFYRDISHNLKNSKYYLEDFIEISNCFSSLLPPVSIKSLFDVDDLLYKDQIEQDYKSIIGVKFLHRNIDVRLYIDCYSTFLRKGVRNIFMDTAFMKLMEHMPIFFQKWTYQHLLQTKDVYDTCSALKIIVAGALNTNVKFRFDAEKSIYDEIWLCMEYLKKIPQGCSSNGKRLSEFISQHAAMFMDLTDPNITVHGFDFVKASIVKMISERRFPANEHIVSLIDSFMNFKSSERDELPNYLFKLMEGTDESVKEALKYIGHRCDANKPNTLPQTLMRIIFDHIITNAVRLGEKLLKVEKEMRFIDAVYGYKIEPYFPMNNEYKYRAFNNEASMSNEAFGFNKEFTSFEDFQARELSIEKEDNIIEKEDNIIEKEDNIIEKEDNIIFQKFFVYDEFMRSLHCLSIFHELFMELERRFEAEFPQSFVYSNFWSMVPTFGLMPWYVKMIVMKCPFLLKSSENKFIDMSFDDLTTKEQEFIEGQNWTNRIYNIYPKTYVNKYHPRSSPVSLPAPEDYFIPEKTLAEYLEEIEKLMSD